MTDYRDSLRNLIRFKGSVRSSKRSSSAKRASSGLWQDSNTQNFSWRESGTFAKRLDTKPHPFNPRNSLDHPRVPQTDLKPSDTDEMGRTTCGSFFPQKNPISLLNSPEYKNFSHLDHQDTPAQLRSTLKSRSYLRANLSPPIQESLEHERVTVGADPDEAEKLVRLNLGNRYELLINKRNREERVRSSLNGGVGAGGRRNRSSQPMRGNGKNRYLDLNFL